MPGNLAVSGWQPFPENFPEGSATIYAGPCGLSGDLESDGDSLPGQASMPVVEPSIDRACGL
jgi:hypothetical protein